MENKDYIELLSLCMQGKTSERENRLLREWFATAEARENIYEEYQVKWDNASDELTDDIKLRMYNNIRAHISPRRNTTGKHLRRIVRIAAAACLVAAVGLGSHLLTKNSLLSDKEFIVCVDKGQKAAITLPDGTLAWLNSGSELSYNNSYNTSDRRLRLTGEAYFEVAKSTGKPFVVSTGGLEVEALGTKFNVNAYSGSENTTVMLVEGRLRVSDMSNEVLMKPDDRVVYNRTSRDLKKERVYGAGNIASWRNDELVFYGETLGEIAQILERMYNVEIHFTSEATRKFSFYGTIRNKSLSNVLDIISMTVPINYDIGEDTIDISPSVNEGTAHKPHPPR